MLLVISTGAHAGSAVSSQFAFCFLSYSSALASPISSPSLLSLPPLDTLLSSTTRIRAPSRRPTKSASTSHSYFALSDGLCALCEPSYVINPLPRAILFCETLCLQKEREGCAYCEKTLWCVSQNIDNEAGSNVEISFGVTWCIVRDNYGAFLIRRGEK